MNYLGKSKARLNKQTVEVCKRELPEAEYQEASSAGELLLWRRCKQVGGEIVNGMLLDGCRPGGLCFDG